MTSYADQIKDDKVMPVAIVGVGGRFPGDASNPEKLWELLSQGRSAMTEIPKDRFNVDAFYHPHAERIGAQNFKGAHFMNRVPEAFDAPFFSITPNEAKAMDPQQRMCLEVAYEAMENAGIRMENMVGSSTSCYVGCFTQDYHNMMSHDPENFPAYFPTGVAAACLSNRVSWFYDLKGPSMTVDTACSSSLVALHLACQSVRSGESEVSLVGGVNFMISPEYNVTMSTLHFLTPDSKCQSFDHKGNGYARGEGCSFVVIKPLEAALRDNDVIRAVIRNTGCNQDGNTPGITLPSADAQATLIRRVYGDAGLSLADTGYFEAHGTGTAAGDPIETSALGETFGKARPHGDPLWVGSIKANIGHLEGASGLAGLTKALYVLEKAAIPPQVWLEKINPRILTDEWNLAIPTELTPWPKEGLRRVSINSFGFGGANAHAVLDDAYHYMKARGIQGHHNTRVEPHTMSPSLSSDSGVSLTSPVAPVNTSQLFDQHTLDQVKAKLRTAAPKLVVWSAHEQSGIKRISETYTKYLEEKVDSVSELEQDQIMQRFAFTTASRRSILPWKSFLVATDLKELSSGMDDFAKPIRSSKVPKVAFIFTGQGAQWYAMGRELMSHQVFVQSLEAATAHLTSLGCEWSLINELLADEKASRIDGPAFSQPMCTALQIAMVELLRYWGITPSAVAGHSSGEIAAAFAKGALSREDAWTVAYERGRLSSKIKELAPQLDGTMLAAGVGEKEAREYLSKATDGQASVACVNSPSSVTFSGDTSAINQIEAALKTGSKFARKLKVQTAYHSAHMQVIGDLYLQSLSGIQTLPEESSTVKMFSSVTGELVQSPDLGAAYWVSNMLNTVRFSPAVKALVSYTESKRRRAGATKSYVDVLLELGPHGALQGPLKQILTDSKIEAAVMSALNRGKDAVKSSLEIAGRLFQQGYPVIIENANNSAGTEVVKQKILVDMPPFPWNHTNKYWCESALAYSYRFRKHPRDDLLGTLTDEWNEDEPAWRHFFRISENPWIEDHSVHNTLLYPAAGMMVMALQAAAQVADTNKEVDGYELRDVLVGNAMIVPRDEDGVETMLHLKPWRTGTQAATADWKEFTIYSRPGREEWSRNCSGLLRIKYKGKNENVAFQNEQVMANQAHKVQYQKSRAESTTVETAKHFYDHQFKIGLQLGVTFRNLFEINKGYNQSACAVSIPDMAATMPKNYITKHVIHPCTLDAIVQTLLPTVEGQYGHLKTAAIPTYIERVFVSADIPSTPGTVFRTYSLAGYTGLTEAEASVYASTEEWEKPMVVFERIRATRLSALQDVADGAKTGLNLRKITGEFHWQADISNMNNHEIEALCAETLSKCEVPAAISASDLEKAASYYAQKALKACPEDAVDSSKPHLRKLYTYLQKVLPTKETSAEVTAEDFCLSREAQEIPDGDLLHTIGIHLEAILRGQTDPAVLLAQDGKLAHLECMAQGRPQALSQLSTYLGLLAHHNPAMKILELGAGNSAVTERVLEALAPDAGTTPFFKSFTVTDASKDKIDAVAAKFNQGPVRTSFKKLDVSTDPLAQGFQKEEFDLIIAPKLCPKELNNITAILKPGAKLIFGNVMSETLRYPLLFGLLDESFDFSVLSANDWNEALYKQGFAGIEVTLPDFHGHKSQSFSFFSSTLLPYAVKELPTDIFIVEGQNVGAGAAALSTELTHLLHALGVETRVITLSDIASIELSGKSFVVLAELDQPLLYNLGSHDFENIRKMILGAASTTWITQGGAVDCEDPKQSLITGFARTIRQETPGINFNALDLDPQVAVESGYHAGFIIKALRAHSVHKGDAEFAVRDGRILVPRIHLSKGANELIAVHNSDPVPESLPFKQPGRALTLTVGTPGMLDTLYFKDDDTWPLPMKSDDVEFEVKASGLNFMDIMVAMDQIQEPAVGLECSGVVTRVGSDVRKVKPGDRVMTWLLGGFSNYVRNAESMIQPIPDDMSFETAASVPMIYCTAYSSIIEEARLEKGEKILIHAAAGGVGQAAIQLAQHIGAEIFATVGSQAKKQHIMEVYGIQEDHIFNSRDLSFVDGIKRMTNGIGVDVVLNSLAGEALRQSWHCLSWFGRFVELGKKDITGNTGLDMAPFMRNISFHAVNVIGTLRASIPRASRLFQRTVDYLSTAQRKHVTPVTTMDFSQIEAGFRSLQSGKQIGKVVFKAHDNDLVQAIPRKVKEAKFNPGMTYVLSGGLGGLGRTLSQWMVDHGAKNLAFFSRSGGAKADAKALLEKLASEGINAKAYACDIGDAEAVERAVQQCQSEMPPIRGVIQAAMSLADAAYTNMTPEQWTLSVNPKAPGTWNLHQYLPKNLDFFVMLSSSSGIAGNRGQSNYAAGNTFQDALAHHRASQGLSAITIDVGPVLGAGHVAENAELIESLGRQGYVALRQEEFIGLIQAAVTGETVAGQPTPRQVITAFATGGFVAAEGWEMPYYFEDAKMRHIVEVDVDGGDMNNAAAGWQTQMSSLASIGEGADLVSAALSAKLAKLMMVAPEDIDTGKPISTYGVDSLTAVEIRAWSFRELQSDISIFEIMSNIPISMLARTVVLKSKFVPKEVVDADN